MASAPAPKARASMPSTWPGSESVEKQIAPTISETTPTV